MPPYRLAYRIDKQYGDNGEGGQNNEKDFEVFLELTAEVNGIKTALLETGSTVFMMVVVMMFGH